MPTLNLARHEKYWRRCLKTFLPTQYTSNDASRMTFGCFSLSALDILGKLDESINEEERNDFIEWIYLCQHPKGGFRGFTGTNFEAHALRTIENDEWDPANIAGTYFALASLLTLGDDLSRVKRRECLMWLKKLQVKDGSFGEVLGANDVPSAGQDVRYCFLAALVRWILREPGNTENDFDVEALKAFILQSVSHEGGVGRAPFHEAHGRPLTSLIIA
jgi:geranylgeranyl transferase type-1 subunit beta